MTPELQSIIENAKKLAQEAGFTNTAPLDVSSIHLYSEVRDMCAANKCGKYNKNWACPPACGTLEDCKAMLKHYKTGLIMQSTGRLEDSFDYEGIENLSKKHDDSVQFFAGKIKLICPDAKVAGAGCCKLCGECAYPEPCRHPDKIIHSMEALGMLVSEVCEKNNLPYYYGKDTLTYTACVFLK